MKTLSLYFSRLLPAAGLAPALRSNSSIDWHKISGSGGTSTGAIYQVTSTLGQPDASSAMSGGQYSVTGGFWSLIAMVQTAGLPNLSIAHSGNSAGLPDPADPRHPLSARLIGRFMDVTATAEQRLVLLDELQAGRSADPPPPGATIRLGPQSPN